MDDNKVKAQMGTTGFTPQEGAKVLTDRGFPISPKQLRRALRKGKVEGAVQLSGRWYIPRSALNRFIKGGEKAQKDTE